MVNMKLNKIPCGENYKINIFNTKSVKFNRIATEICNLHYMRSFMMYIVLCA